jgi:hypothetical protein
MADFSVVQAKVDERRRFERIGVPYEASVFVLDKKGKRAGVVRQLGRGGMMIEPEGEFKKGKSYTLVIVDDSEGIRRKVDLVVRYADPRHVGCEFQKLDADAAVEIGILIGKYYSGKSSI